MVLSLILSKNLLSGVLIDEKNTDSVKFHSQALEYKASKFEPLLTKELLQEFLAKGLESQEDLSSLKICIVPVQKNIVVPDLGLDIVELEAFSKMLKYNWIPVMLDQDFINEQKEYIEENLDDFLNYEHYGIPFSKDMLLTLDTITINKEITRVVSNAEVVVSNLYNHFDDAEMKKYLSGLFKFLVPLNPKVRNIKLVFDNQFKYAALLAAIQYLKINPKDFFKNKPMDSDVNVINLNGVKKFTIEKNGTDVTDKIAPDKINYYPLSREDEITITSSVIKEKFTHNLGLVIDTRSHGKK